MQYDVWSVKIKSSANFYVTSVTPSGAGALTLAATTPGINGYGYKVSITGTGNETAKNFTITGTTVGGVVVTKWLLGQTTIRSTAQTTLLPFRVSQ